MERSNRLIRCQGRRLRATLAIGFSVTLAVAATAVAAGPLDGSFGSGGVVLSEKPRNAAALAIARDSRGGLIAVGTTIFEDFAVARFQSDGDLDPAFGDGGEVTTEAGREAAAGEVAIQRDGKIVVAGGTESSIALNRYLPDGRLDEGIGKAGRVLTRVGAEGGADALAMTIQRSGRILVAGYGVDAARNWTGVLIAYRSDGRLDRRFGTGGFVRFPAPGKAPVALSGVEELSDGRVLVTGDLGGRLLLVRLRGNGKPDRSFGGGDGLVVADVGRCSCLQATALALAPRGRPVIAANVPGREGLALLARFRPDGTPDSSFGTNGSVRTRRGRGLAIQDVAIRRDGRIVAAGYYNHRGDGEAQVAVLRYLPSGRLDPGFARSGFFSRDLGFESVGSGVLIEPDGGAVVVGRGNRSGPGFPDADSALDNARFMLMRFRR